MNAGYRACKLCKPLAMNRPPALVSKLMQLASQRHERLTSDDLQKLGIDPSTARRQFQAYCRTSFAKWQVLGELERRFVKYTKEPI